MNRMTMQIEGMSCGHCKVAVEKALAGRTGRCGSGCQPRAENRRSHRGTHRDRCHAYDAVEDAGLYRQVRFLTALALCSLYFNRVVEQRGSEYPCAKRTPLERLNAIRQRKRTDRGPGRDHRQGAVRKIRRDTGPARRKRQRRSGGADEYLRNPGRGEVVDGELVPADGRLWYRGYDIHELVGGVIARIPFRI